MFSKFKKMLSNGSHRTCHELSTLFADSLASTLHDWLGYATGLSVLVYPHSHSIDAGSGIEHSTSCADDVGGVGVDKLEKEEIVDKTCTSKATFFTCNKRRKSACWRSSWQVFPNIFRINFGEDITDVCIALVLMCNDFLLCWWKPVWFSKKVFLNFSSNLEDTLSRLEFSDPEISSNKLYCPSAVFGIVTTLVEITSFALSFTLWNSDASICIHLLKVCYHKSAFPNFSPAYQTYSRSDSGNTVLPNWWNFNRSKNGVIIIPTSLWCFSQIVAIHHGIHPPSSSQLQQSRKGSFLHSAYRYSAIWKLFERRGVD